MSWSNSATPAASTTPVCTAATIQDHDWDSIHVVGGYDREAVISAHEKTGKLFNFERPTADVQGRDLIVKAFPGADYVHHYALIIATYLSMTGKPAETVTYELPDPTLSRDAVGKLALDLDGDLVIVGWGLAHLAPPDGVWNHGHGYAWQHTEIHGRRVVYLGSCTASGATSPGESSRAWRSSAPARSSMSAKSAR